jgi:hypothetical protein
MNCFIAWFGPDMNFQFISMVMRDGDFIIMLLYLSCRRKILFFQIMTYNEKNTYNNEWESNHQYDA